MQSVLSFNEPGGIPVAGSLSALTSEIIGLIEQKNFVALEDLWTGRMEAEPENLSFFFTVAAAVKKKGGVASAPPPPPRSRHA